MVLQLSCLALPRLHLYCLAFRPTPLFFAPRHSFLQLLCTASREIFFSPFAIGVPFRWSLTTPTPASMTLQQRHTHLSFFSLSFSAAYTLGIRQTTLHGEFPFYMRVRVYRIDVSVLSAQPRLVSIIEPCLGIKKALAFCYGLFFISVLKHSFPVTCIYK